MSERSNEDILAELGVGVEVKSKAALTSREERIIAGFEDIQRFVEEHGKPPSHGPDKDIFERIYATRLDQIRRQSECTELLKELDFQGLLEGAADEDQDALNAIDNEALLGELGVEVEAKGKDDITVLHHVKSRDEVRVAEEIAQQKRCDDFDIFRPLFEAIKVEIKAQKRALLAFKDDGSLSQGNFYILRGQMLYISQKSEEFTNKYGRPDSRLRVIYDNGTESNILMRSLIRALYKDDSGRRVSDPFAGPLFKSEPSEGDQASGTIYICRSLSNDPYINEHRDIIHKIGVTNGSVETRIAAAETDSTYLFAKVKLVATYELYNINRNKLEKLLHRFFENARLNVRIQDRFGKPVSPREWFVVPIDCIEEAIERIKDKSIQNYKYDVKEAKLIKVHDAN